MRSFLSILILPLSLCHAEDAVVKIPKTPVPAYLETFTDPAFGSEVTRITGIPGTPIPNIDSVWNEVTRHQYSKTAVWNSDQTLLLLSRHNGFPSFLFLDGKTYEPLFGRNNCPGSEVRWHPTRPDILVFVKDNLIGYWNVREDTTETVAKIEGGYSGFHIGPWEGNLSRDGRFIVVNGLKGRMQVAFAYDLEKKKKHPDIVFDGPEIDWSSVSASGKYIVVNGAFDGDNPDQTKIYTMDGKETGEFWGEIGRPSHYDLTLDSDGEDIAVGVSKSKPDDGRVIKRRLRDGKVTVLTNGGYASHASARNTGRPGWAYITYQHPGPTWPPYWNEVVAVKLDGSKTVERIAHMHANTTDYLTEAHAVPSPDGKRVLWASAWGAEKGRPLAAYVAELPGKSGDR